MTEQERWEKVRDLFEEAKSMSAAERDHFLSALPADDALRGDLEQLLASHDSATEFMEGPVSVSNEILCAVAEAIHAEIHVDALLGRTLKDRYQVEKIIGEGGFGRAYLARDLMLDSCPVVVKVLSKPVKGDRWRERRFMEEIQALARIDHPGVVRILDHGSMEDGCSYLVLQYVPGETLRRVLKIERLDVPRIVRLTAQIAEALSAAHRAGICHRDLKPENIQIRETGRAEERAVILDFGIARIMSGEEASGKSTVIAGSPAYMAPEHRAGKAVPASDIYALGLMVFEMLTGEKPAVESLILEPQKLVEQVLAEKRSDLPIAARNAVAKATSASVADRFASATEFAQTFAASVTSASKDVPEIQARLEALSAKQEQLERELRQRDAAEAGEVEEDGERDGSDSSGLHQASRTDGEPKRMRRRTIVAIVAVFAVVGLVAFNQWPSRPPEPGVFRILITDLDCPDANWFRMFRRNTGITEDLRFTNTIEKELHDVQQKLPGGSHIEVVRLKVRMRSNEDPTNARALLAQKRGHVLIWGDISACNQSAATESIHVDWKFGDVPGSYRYSERRIKITEDSSIVLPKFDPKETTALVFQILALSQRGILALSPDPTKDWRDVQQANVQAAGILSRVSDSKIDHSTESKRRIAALSSFNDGVTRYHLKDFGAAARSFGIASQMEGGFNNWGLSLYKLGMEMGLPKGEAPWRDAFGKFGAAIEAAKKSIPRDDQLIVDFLNNWGIALDDLAQTLAADGKQEGADRLWEEAFQKFEEALAYNADRFEANNNWGLAEFEWAKRKPRNQMETPLRRAIRRLDDAAKSTKHAGDSGTALSNSVAVLLELAKDDGPKRAGFLADAKKRGEKALKNDGRLAAYNLACVALRYGDEESARNYLMRAKDRGDLPSRDTIDHDTDLDAVRSKPWFSAIRESAEQ